MALCSIAPDPLRPIFPVIRIKALIDDILRGLLAMCTGGAIHQRHLRLRSARLRLSARSQVGAAAETGASVPRIVPLDLLPWALC